MQGITETCTYMCWLNKHIKKKGKLPNIDNTCDFYFDAIFGNGGFRIYLPRHHESPNTYKFSWFSQSLVETWDIHGKFMNLNCFISDVIFWFYTDIFRSLNYILVFSLKTCMPRIGIPQYSEWIYIKFTYINFIEQNILTGLSASCNGKCFPLTGVLY